MESEEERRTQEESAMGRRSPGPDLTTVGGAMGAETIEEPEGGATGGEGPEELTAIVERMTVERSRLQDRGRTQQAELEAACHSLEEASNPSDATVPREEADALRDQKKIKIKKMWCLNCEQFSIKMMRSLRFKARLSEFEVTGHLSGQDTAYTCVCEDGRTRPTSSLGRCLQTTRHCVLPPKLEYRPHQRSVHCCADAVS